MRSNHRASHRIRSYDYHTHQIHLSVPDYITAKKAKVIVMFEEKSEKPLNKKVNLMKYSGTITWKEDGMSYQNTIRVSDRKFIPN